jgi:hypothetical protein
VILKPTLFYLVDKEKAKGNSFLKNKKTLKKYFLCFIVAFDQWPVPDQPCDHTSRFRKEDGRIHLPSGHCVNLKMFLVWGNLISHKIVPTLISYIHGW